MIGPDQKRNLDTYDNTGRSAIPCNGSQIRAATVTDAAAIMMCSDLAFASFAEHSDKADVKQVENLKSQIREGSIQLISHEGRLLGYISLWPSADRMFIDTLAVLPKHQRQGLGSRLLAFAECESLQRGLKAISLFTKAPMADNLVFYQSRGYRETGRCDDDGFCRVFYTKDLSPVTAVTFSASPPAASAGSRLPALIDDCQ